MGKKDRDNFFNNLSEHSEAKVKLLENYIVPWIRKVNFGIGKGCLICDTFAGEGIYEDGTKGSPMIILEAAINYFEQRLSYYYPVILAFVEKDSVKYQKLKNNLEQKLEQEIIEGDFCEVIKYNKLYILLLNSTHENFLEEVMKDNDSLMPSLFFVDPFGFKGLSFEKIACFLNKYKSSEFIVNFMYEEFNRFKNIKSIGTTLDEFFGSDIEEIVEEVKDLSVEERRNKIIDEYKNNFSKRRIKYTLDFDIQKDESNAYKMSMVFLSNNVHGFNVMKDVMLSLSENISFEYKTHERKTPTLFSFIAQEEILKQFKDDVYEKFKGTTVKRYIVENYIQEHNYIPFDKTVLILKCLGDDNKLHLIKNNGKIKEKPKQFKDQDLIVFKGD